MELEIGDLEVTQKPPKREEHIKSLRFWVWHIGEIDREYLRNLEDKYWQLVEKIIERRKNQVARIHQLRTGAMYKLLHELDIDLQVNDYYWPGIANLLDKKRDAINVSYVLDMKRSLGTRRFTRLFRRTVKQWKTKRDRDLHCAISHQAKVIREATTRYIKTRSSDTDTQLALVERELSKMYNYEDIQWLGKDLDKIDIMSLEGRCLEELCFAP